MKKSKLLSVFIAGIALAVIGAGCHRKPQNVTNIPGMEGPSANNGGIPPGGNIGNQPQGIDRQPGIPQGHSRIFEGPNNEDPEKFKADTVYFDFDSASIKPSEDSKLQDVYSYFKNDTTDGLIVQGNCDERGTEKYNLALGERRALAVREYLANLGMNPDQIKTVTFGKSKPADPGHNEEAWKKNRRGDLVLVTPK